MTTAVPALPARSVLLHVGPHKTGTTSVQAKLAAARGELREHGVLYPGPRGAHHAEARAFVGSPEGFAGDGPPLQTKAWKRLTRIARESDEKVVLSSEFFSWASLEDLTRLGDELDLDAVHVLIAARNCGRLALSGWQQGVSSGNRGSLAEWLEERFRREEAGTGGSNFWFRYDPAALVERWSTVLDLDRIHVVVLDESDHGLLPATFEQLLDLPAGLVADQPTDQHNRSLTAPEIEIVRSTGDVMRDELSWDEYSLLFRTGVGRQLIYSRTPAPDEVRTALPAWAVDQAGRETESTIARLLASGAHLVGDVTNLRATLSPGEPVAVESVPVELAVHAVAGSMKAAQRRIRWSARRIAELEAQATPRPDLAAAPARDLAAELRRRIGARLTRPFRRDRG